MRGRECVREEERKVGKVRSDRALSVSQMSGDIKIMYLIVIMLKKHNTLFTDIDECAMKTSQCQHICVNQLGSYDCECHNNYTLQNDGKSCKIEG
jgi:hypothetical protein